MDEAAKKKAATAAKQAKHAASNVGEAAKITVAPVVEEVEDRFEEVADAAKRFNRNTAAKAILGVSLAAGVTALAMRKFHQTWVRRDAIIEKKDAEYEPLEEGIK